MESAYELIKNVKTSDPFRDFIIFVGGFCFVLLYYYFVNSDIFFDAYILEFNDFINIFTLLIISYIIGRILITISEVLVGSLYFLSDFLFKKKKSIKVFDFCKEFLYSHKSPIDVDLEKWEKDITDSHLKLFIQKNDLGEVFLRREIYAGTLERQYLAISLIFTFLVSPYIFIPLTIFFLIKSINTDKNIIKQKVEIMKLIAVEREDIENNT